MASKINHYNYRSLFEWSFEQNLPDEWYVAVNGHTKDELYNLKQVQEFSAQSPSSSIQVLNKAHSEDADAEWLPFIGQVVKKEDSSGAAGCAFTLAALMPAIGFLVGLFLLPDVKTRDSGIGVIFTSILMSGVYWFIWCEMSQ